LASPKIKKPAEQEMFCRDIPGIVWRADEKVPPISFQFIAFEFRHGLTLIGV
jgi:hypothetical protein